MKALDVATLPLSGTHLIEASAGTGKTFTLAHLYLRLIVERGLTVEQILVVTFTRAAVQELRTRLRQSIVDARAVLADPDSANGLLADLILPYRDKEGLAEQLEAAQLSMDQAAISTIHTFCTQLLSDNAFESSQLFDMQVEDRDSELQLLAVREYWRQHFLALSSADTQWVHRSLKSPAFLLAQIRILLSANAPQLLPAGSKSGYDKQAESVQATWQRLQKRWTEEGTEIHALVAQDANLNRGKIRVPTVAKAADWLDVAVASEALPGALPDMLKVFRDSHLQGCAKKDKQAPEHAFFLLIDELWDLLGPLAALRMSVELNSCAAFVAHWLVQHKAKLRLLSYEDLLHYAAAALDGQGGDALAERLRVKFPAALIDEFQDTDPRQYGIFSALYAGQGDLAWYMIGDPKQAIYSFRGADINTYLMAAAQSENSYTLGTNWRSTSAMVAAVNGLFGNTERPFALEGQVGFTPVDASGAKDDHVLLRGDEQQPALRLAELALGDDGKVLNKGAATTQAARITAALIAEQLQAGQDGKLYKGKAPLAPADIAVLVRSNRQGRMINEALAALDIASVVTGNDSIFASLQALNLCRLLQALAEPSNERLLLRVLASDLCGFAPGELLYLQQHDAQWQQHLEVFTRFALLLKRQGLLAALLALLAEYGTAARLRGQTGGERSLSNYLQLGELLQQAWQEQPDLDSLLVWLERHIESPKDAGDVAQLRLETDEKLVQIVTVHKSKGLEYPVVYLPYVWAARAPKSSDTVLCHTDKGPCLDLGSAQIDDHREQMQQESLAEDVRLLYVALTRAASQCTLIWGDVKGAELSAMARLMGQHGEKMAVGFSEMMQRWVAECPEAELIDTPEARPLSQVEHSETLIAEQGSRPPRPSWQISSYSALVRHAHGQASGQPASHAELPDHDAADPRRSPAEAPPTDLNSIMFFPRGAQAGTYLHYVFEHADFPSAQGPELQKLVEESLAAHGYADSWRTAVLSMMQEVLDTPLAPVSNCRLRDLSAADRLNEMNFHFPVPQLSCTALMQVLRQHGVIGEHEFLDFNTVKGYMTGFIDLIFRHEGQYFVLDYKSNHLGYTPEDYNSEALLGAMREHRYDLQYLMYTVALHRYLNTRIPDYHYEQHMGGSFYLFLRGMRPTDPAAPGIFYDKPPLDLILALDALFANEGAPA